MHAHVVLRFLKTQKDHKFQSVLLGSVFALLGADRGVVNEYLIIVSFWATWFLWATYPYDIHMT